MPNDYKFGPNGPEQLTDEEQAALDAIQVEDIEALYESSCCPESVSESPEQGV